MPDATAPSRGGCRAEPDSQDRERGNDGEHQYRCQEQEYGLQRDPENGAGKHSSLRRTH